VAICRKVVERHGGNITARSTGGDVPGSNGQAETRPRNPGQRILVIEVNRDSADSLRLLLECYGYEVTVACRCVR
jgi:hypothetical protein